MTLFGRLLRKLLATLVTGLPRVVHLGVERVALLLDDVAQLLRDVVVHTAEVVALELVAALAAELLEHLADAFEALAVAVAEPGLHHPPEGVVEVAVVQQVVGDLREDRIGVELEPDLGAVPPGVAEPSGHGRTLPLGRTTYA